MLISTKKQNPDVPIVVTFDAKGKNFRHQIFEAYKAARPPMPEELRPQIQPVKDICKAMGFTVLSIAEVEAASLEDAEKIVNEKLSDFVGSNPDLEKKMGAKAIQGKGYLPGSEEEA